MSYVTLRPRTELVDDRHEDGTVWRTLIYVNAHLVDGTPWCASPARASALGRDLAHRWAQLRRRCPDREEVNA